MMPASGEITDAGLTPKQENNSFKGQELDFSSRNLTTIPCHFACQSNIVTSLILDHNELISLPHDLGHIFPTLEVLSLIGNDLSLLTDSLGCLSQLKELYLNENSLTKIPDSICLLSKLEILKLTANQLTELPKDFGRISSLVVVHAGENKIQNLPDSLCDLSNLEFLEVEENILQSLPNDLGKLTSLRVLNVSDNKILEVPNSLGDLQHLELVDLSNNFLKILPVHMKSVHSIKKFFADKNSLSLVPRWMNELSEVTEISLKDNKFYEQAVPDGFGLKNKKLRELDLSGNFMTKLPDSIGALVRLEKFCLGSVLDELERRGFSNGNWLSCLPDSVCNLVHLKHMRLDENQFHFLPKEFGKLVHLEYLDLGQNMLTDLPESFGSLRSLKVCLLSRNSIQFLPCTFGNLQNLENLRLDNNLLQELPESFCKLTNLKSLDLFNNKLTEVPSAIKHFPNLVMMDLNKNNFGIPLEDIPQLGGGAKYAERNPEWKNNWRGRRQEGIFINKSADFQVEKTTGDSSEEEEDSLLYQGYSRGEEMYRRAALRNLYYSVPSQGLWRSHLGPNEREVYVREPVKDGLSEDIPKKSEDKDSSSENSSYNDEFNPDDFFEPPIFIPKTMKFNLGNIIKEEKKFIQNESTEENWDDEIVDYYQNNKEEKVDFENVFPHPMTLEEAGYVVDEHLFLPYDIHSQPVFKSFLPPRSEEGQFDDAEED